MPSIPVGVQTAATAKEVRPFECVHCSHRTRAEVVGLGEGVQSFLNAPGTAAQRAHEDAKKDIDRTMRRARCPKCGRRDPRGVLAFFSTYLIIAAVVTAAGVVCGFAPAWFDINMSDRDKDICKWVVPLLFTVSLLLVLPLQILIKWSTTDSRIRWMQD